MHLLNTYHKSAPFMISLSQDYMLQWLSVVEMILPNVGITASHCQSHLPWL